MRSVYASMLALALTVLLCACVSRVPVWETVDDEFVCQMPRRPSTIVFAVPDGWASDVFSPGGLSRQYTAPDGSYEISATVFETSDPESAIRQLTGLDASRFDLIRTTRFSLPEYQFAWSAETDDGDRLYRAAMLCDEQYCYALCFSAPADSGTSYDSIQESVFASFGLYYDETVVLLSKGEVDSKKIRVEFSLEDMDMSEFQDGATYTQIKDYVLEHSGLKVSNLYISQIKRKCGIEVGKNYNLPKSEDSRQPQCPPEKEKAIREAFKYFGMI